MAWVLFPVSHFSRVFTEAFWLIYTLCDCVCVFACCGYFSVAQSCLTLCDLMDCSAPGFPVLHHLLEFTQTCPVIPSNHLILRHPLLLPPSVFPTNKGLFQWVVSASMGFPDGSVVETTHSGTLAGETPWTEEPGGLQSMGSQRIRHA